MSALNPYETPKGADLPATVVEPDAPSAQAVFVAWEKLRVWYNLVLMVETLAVMPFVWSQWTEPREIRAVVVLGAVAANICFCIGPCAEGYICWMGARRAITRSILFVGGTLVACLLALLTLVERM